VVFSTSENAPGLSIDETMIRGKREKCERKKRKGKNRG
jgi:hypothetical protein